eukprot:UN11822
MKQRKINDRRRKMVEQQLNKKSKKSKSIKSNWYRVDYLQTSESFVE